MSRLWKAVPVAHRCRGRLRMQQMAAAATYSTRGRNRLPASLPPMRRSKTRKAVIDWQIRAVSMRLLVPIHAGFITDPTRTSWMDADHPASCRCLHAKDASLVATVCSPVDEKNWHIYSRTRHTKNCPRINFSLELVGRFRWFSDSSSTKRRIGKSRRSPGGAGI